jgi:predicted nucleic acid-binding protein
MNKVFVDSDIILDMLAHRDPFYDHAANLFESAVKGRTTIYISALCFHNLNYMLSKQYTQVVARQILIKFKTVVEVLHVDSKIIDRALHSDFSDFEDAVQYHVALENKIPVLITRNLKDYKKSTIPVMTAETYLNK